MAVTLVPSEWLDSPMTLSRTTGRLHRDELIVKADLLASARACLVVGPAGSGKSVLLEQLAMLAPPGQVVLSCPLGAHVRTEAELVARLARVLHVVVPRRVDALLDALAGTDMANVVLHLDDTHTITATPAEHALARFIAEAPPSLRFVLAGRDERVAGLGGDVPRIDHDDLRLREHEVAQLFAQVYRAPLAPELAAELCDRTEGHLGIVRLLHADTALLPAAERIAALKAAHSPSLATFLTREVLDPLPTALREFMIAASPLGVLDGPLCDAALSRTDSHRLLAELTARQALTFRVRHGGGSHRFHGLLQRHLEQLLVERTGARRAHQAYRSAAVHLAEAGRWTDAYRCHARAGDWVAAAGVLHRFGAQSVQNKTDDPWVALAEARRLRGEGRLDEALENYARAETALPDPVQRWQCALERSGVARWAGRPVHPLVGDICGHVADAVRSHPAKLLNRAVPAHSPEWTLGRAVAAMLDGRPSLALELCGPLTAGPPGFVTLASRLLVAALGAIARGTGTVSDFAELAADCERAGWLWLARVARAATAVIDPDGCADAAAIVEECSGIGDKWGALLAGAFLAVGRLRADQDAIGALSTASMRARALDARVPQAWLHLVLVDELERRGDRRVAVERAEVERLLAAAVLDRAREHGSKLLAVLRAPAAAPAPCAGGEPLVVVRCLGSYTVTIGGTEVDLSGLRAQARRVLRMLTLHCGQPVHEERLVTALWPDSPAERTKHRLQVAISSLRALLRKHLPPGHGIVRQGNAYLLRLPAGSLVDVLEFTDTAHRWRTARRAGDNATATALGQRLLELYHGELLTEEGAEEWLLAQREALRGLAAGAAVVLAHAAMAGGDWGAAIEACERGVTIDDLDSRLWTMLAAARLRTGNHAAAVRAEDTYRTLVAEA
ncbi:BTAD domain-containing putative transcriptional regulator [Labedaea rhizosphaerae]|uniref:Transcriptional regulator n=1 Tax=Labedaea rhizosphaerae TaxID=598644 RepID=A0A4R6SFJ0_LABRH|nr:BTAD domain-containing putative transcriptional regulator [Labedaea rhizosphaerae]TDQ00782.1 transcriptional regulator [Labedaea rhizosphaerae]